MKVQNNCPSKYITYSLASYYLSLIRSGIWWIKSGDSSVNVIFVFVFTITFCYHMKRLLIISNFLKIDKATVNNWHCDLDDKVMRECVESVLQSLHSRLT